MVTAAPVTAAVQHLYSTPVQCWGVQVYTGGTPTTGDDSDQISKYHLAPSVSYIYLVTWAYIVNLPLSYDSLSVCHYMLAIFLTPVPAPAGVVARLS